MDTKTTMNGDKQSHLKKKKPKRKCENCRDGFGCFTFLRTTWRTFKEFSADTSIHGIKYLTDKRLPWSEKLFWAIALILSSIAAGYFIQNTFRQWQQTPVIVTLSENFMNVWEIPHPAFTICPIGGANPLSNDYKNLNVTNKQHVNRSLNYFEDTDSMKITNTLWMSKPYNSSDLFRKIVTEEGYCYSFNSKNYYDLFNHNVEFEAYEYLKDTNKTPHTDWMLETGYHSNKSPKVYPRRAAGSGEIAGLQFDIHRQLTEFKDNDSFEKGFKIVFHLPNEVPRLIKQFYRIPLEKKVTIIVDPSMIVTENLESYSIETRQCYFEKERKLKYFRSYTRSNCQIECSANYTRKKCNCIHHSMPRLDNETTCDNEQQSCYHEGKLDTLNHIMEKSLNTSRNRYDRGKMACECLPACTSLEYNAVTSQDEIRYFGKIRDSRKFRSSISIFLKHDDFIYSKRSELYSATEFIANFGGILGLFLGVSILSIVEVIYFIAFRDVKSKDNEEDLDNVEEDEEIGDED